MTVTSPAWKLPNSAPEWEHWESVRNRVDKLWDPENTPHHAVIGLSGSGKTYLVVNGILGGMCKHDRVLIIDTKQDDPLLMKTGRPVTEIPRNPWYAGIGRRKTDERAFWYRLVVHDSRHDHNKARLQVANALDRVYDDGDWVVYFDEVLDATGPRRPLLALAPRVEHMWRKGRSRHISIIAGTQSPAWVPRLMYDQASFAWIGRIRDKQRQKRLLEIGGFDTSELPYVATLQRRQWLLSADNGEYMARTTVKV